MKEILESFGGWPLLKGDSWNASNQWSSIARKLKDFGLSTNYIVTFSMSPDLYNGSQFVMRVRFFTANETGQKSNGEIISDQSNNNYIEKVSARAKNCGQ